MYRAILGSCGTPAFLSLDDDDMPIGPHAISVIFKDCASEEPLEAKVDPFETCIVLMNNSELTPDWNPNESFPFEVPC